MSKRAFFLRYFHILNKLREAPATFKEIDQYLLQQSERQDYCFNTSKRQFMRDLKDISVIFEVDIAFDHIRQAYFIHEHSEISRIRMEAFDAFNALKIGENTSRSTRLLRICTKEVQSAEPDLQSGSFSSGYVIRFVSLILNKFNVNQPFHS